MSTSQPDEVKISTTNGESQTGSATSVTFHLRMFGALAKFTGSERIFTRLLLVGTPLMVLVIGVLVCGLSLLATTIFVLIVMAPLYFDVIQPAVGAFLSAR